MKVAFLTYSHGNNIGSFHFVWKVLDSFDADISESQRTIEKVKEQLPVPRHIAELYEIVLTKNSETNPIMLIYTDGGTDHRLTYLKVQLSLISLFDLDFLCVCHNARYHSWRNPVERVMSIFNQLV